ncbi:MAG TPA: FAD-dependent oxidoreductase [Puia sp.]|uniref:NAD(P)/FAD-dependent oxidoreductase n=1 Tax=Puia sp. TaxID=2045100 RepID=UPI002C117AE3|nr:FAD-dependent oxidoreductase [Puia sp.]HVU99056.1 FAD-dependent oxidoreductase [Puia sp.]
MKIIVIGGNFAGFTASIQLKRKLKEKADVLVIDRNPDMLFVPSLIWVPTGRREVKDILVPRKQVLEKKGVRFLQATATAVDPERHTVHTSAGDFNYDQLVIATGPKVNYDVAPGVREYACYIGTPDGAMKTREKLEAFKSNPGPIVIGATQQAGCMGAAYEFLFNVEKWLRDNKIRRKVDLHWITPETYLGHFGIDGMPLGETMLKTFMKIFHIHYHTGVGVTEVRPDEVVLTNGERIASRFTMLMPPFVGVDMIRNSPQLGAEANGFLEVLPSYRHPHYPDIWVAGLTVNVKPPFAAGPVPFGVPKTGFPSDETGKIVAENIVRTVNGRQDLKEKTWGKIPGLCILDAGKKEVLIVSNHLFKPRVFALMLPNVFYDVMKLSLEKYFLWKMRRGYAQLP